MSSKYLRKGAAAVATPPQSEPLNERQVPNSAGGYSYPVDCWKRLDRFLILGSEGGSYYATEQKLTKENIKAVAECVKQDGIKTVRRIGEISDAGRAYKNDPALLALAYCIGKGDLQTRQEAAANLEKVARIGTHLFHFVDYAQQFRGWGRVLKSAVQGWYLNKETQRLADQVVKYRQRDGWSHRDVLRKSHPKFENPAQNAIADWIVKGEQSALSSQLPDRIKGFIKLQATTNVKEATDLIYNCGLVRECVPTEFLKERLVWEALLEQMPLTAMIRNLGNMSKCGLLTPMSNASKAVVSALGDTESMRKARIHPLQILIAQKTYAQGHGIRGDGQWTPVPKVIDALDDAYYEAFKFVEPTGKRFYLGLDISGSMWMGNVCGIESFFPAVATGAMAMVTVKLEQDYYVAGFTRTTNAGFGGRWGTDNTGMTPIALSPKMRLDTVVGKMEALSAKMGGTDCSLPMLDAMKNDMKVDVFVVMTDNETWAGNIHPTQALEQYRQKTGIPAKLVVMAMVPNNFSIADPNDGGMLDVVGFDANAPLLVGEFAADKL